VSMIGLYELETAKRTTSAQAKRFLVISSLQMDGGTIILCREHLLWLRKVIWQRIAALMCHFSILFELHALACSHDWPTIGVHKDEDEDEDEDED